MAHASLSAATGEVAGAIPSWPTSSPRRPDRAPPSGPGRPLRRPRPRDRVPAARRARCPRHPPRVRALGDDAHPRDAEPPSPTTTLRTAGLSPHKLASLRDLSAGPGRHRRARWLEPQRRRHHRRPVTVRGIGRWTAEMYLMFELRRMDVWPVDDLGVRQGYALAWRLDPPPSAKQLVPLGERFRPYRSIVARYCWAAVRSCARRHGPGASLGPRIVFDRLGAASPSFATTTNRSVAWTMCSTRGSTWSW